MLDKRLIPLLALFMFANGTVQAQTAGVVTLQANQTSAVGSLVPVLTWSTNPVAQSCTASGGWSGTKAASGTQTLASISASTNYTLTCTWPSGSANVTWVAPTTNTNGSALTDLAGFKVVYGTASNALTNTVNVDDITQRSRTISSLSPGTWYFAVRAYNVALAESADSNVATKAVTGVTDARTVAITITAAPPPPPPTGGSEVEPNNTTGTAQVIASAGTTLNGTMSATGDLDYYKITLPAGKTLTATMQPNANSDYELYLYNSAGTTLAWSEKGKGMTETITVTNSGTSAVIYYVRVHMYAGGTGATNGKYTATFAW